MRYFFFLMLLLHTLMEAGLGLLIAVSPQTLTPDAEIVELAFVLNYGFAAIASAAVVLLYWPHRNDTTITGLVLAILAIFHTGEALAGARVISLGGGADILIAHGIFAVCFWLLWSQRKNLTSGGDSQ